MACHEQPISSVVHCDRDGGSAEAIRVFRRRARVWPETGACAPHPIDLPWYLPGMDFSV
jgi:hypothetical protein